MYLVHDLSVHRIGSDLTSQVVLMEAEPVWTSPLFLDLGSASNTVAYLRNQLLNGECDECFGLPYAVSEVLPVDEFDTEPELSIYCEDHYREALR